MFAFLFLQGEQFAFHEDWGEALVGKSCPVLCVLDIEGDNVSVLEGVPENISPGQVGVTVLINDFVLLFFSFLVHTFFFSCHHSICRHFGLRETQGWCL